MIPQSIFPSALVSIAASLMMAVSRIGIVGGDEKLSDAKATFSPYAGKDYPMHPLFGDTHLQISQSFEALE